MSIVPFSTASGKTTLESQVLTSLSLALGVVALLFAVQQIRWLPFLHFGSGNDPFYIAFAILGILVVGATRFFSQRLDIPRTIEKLLVVFLPTEIALVFGLSQSKNFHYIFQILTSAYVIVAGAVAVVRYIRIHRYDDYTHVPMHDLTFLGWWKLQGRGALFFVLVVTTLFFLSGLHDLTRFAAVDEPLWTNGRITKYWHNIEDRDWKGTRISDKPGVTVALAAGPGLWFVTPKEYRSLRQAGELYNGRKNIEDFYLAFRLPFLIVITLLLPFFYFLIERLLGKRIALASYTLVGLSPVLIGMSKIINPDSLLWLLAPLALLAYLVFQKNRRYRFLLIAGGLMGLALLTKYVANIVLVFMIGVIFLEWIYGGRRKEALSVYLKRTFIEFGILVFTALSVFAILFPAVWVKPEKLITATLYSQAFEKAAPLFLGLLIFIVIDIRWNKTRTLTWLLGLLSRFRDIVSNVLLGLFSLSVVITLMNVAFGMRWYDFVELLAAPKTIATKSDLLGIFLTNFYPLLFGITPVVLFGLLLGLYLVWRRDVRDTPAGKAFVVLALFVLLYSLGGAMNGVAMIVRYQIMLFPVAAIMAGIGWVAFWDLTVSRFPSLRKPWLPALGLIGLIVCSLPSVLRTPFPLSYASALLPTRYHIDVKDMGPGSYEAAAWLNRQPNAEGLLIWTDKDGVCKFFVGRCKRGFGQKSLRPEEPFDYIVVSSGRESRTSKMIAPKAVSDPSIARYDLYYDRTDTDFAVYINGRKSHYVKVFRYQP